MVVRPPFWFGMTPAIAGRSIPSSVFRTKRAIAISAPVLPALTQTSALPSLTRLIATRIDEFRLPRSATITGSCISTTSSACTISTDDGSRAGSAAFSSDSRPTSSSAASFWCSRNASDAETVTGMPWSPPMQSMAMRTVTRNSLARHVQAAAQNWRAAAGHGVRGRARSGASGERPCSVRWVAPADYSSFLVATTFLPR